MVVFLSTVMQQQPFIMLSVSEWCFLSVSCACVEWASVTNNSERFISVPWTLCCSSLLMCSCTEACSYIRKCPSRLKPAKHASWWHPSAITVNFIIQYGWNARCLIGKIYTQWNVRSEGKNISECGKHNVLVPSNPTFCVGNINYSRENVSTWVKRI